jgi:hypothetical protein
MNMREKSLNKLLGKPVIVTLAVLAALPITPIILCLIYGWSN